MKEKFKDLTIEEKEEKFNGLINYANKIKNKKEDNNE